MIQIGSISLLAFVFGDYASEVFLLGEFSERIYATLVVLMLTSLNAVGVHHDTRAQNLLTVVEVLGVLLIMGWLTRSTLVAGGLLMTALTFGTALRSE